MTKLFLLTLLSVISANTPINAQLSLEKACRKLSIAESDRIVSNETVELYPMGFLYFAEQPDSVIYLSCLSSDQHTFRDAFEKKGKCLVFPTGISMQRGFMDTAYTIPIEDLSTKISHLNKPELIDRNARSVLFYYWTPDVMDKDFIRNFRFFSNYAAKHPEYGIQVVPVMVE